LVAIMSTSYERAMQDLSGAPALCTVDLSTLGNTGENLKRMQGARESPKISVIDIPSNTNLATASLASFLGTHPYYEYGGGDRTIAGGACGSGCGCGPASPRRPEHALGTDYPVPESAVSVPAAPRAAARRGGRPVPANMVESGREGWVLLCKPPIGR